MISDKLSDSPEPSLKQKTYQFILEGILSSQFTPETLLVEKQLCNLYDVSRSPVREALIELCRDGILRNIPRAGYQVQRLTEKQIRDAFQMRLLLEEEGLKQAYGRLTREKLISLENLAVNSEEALKVEGSLMKRMNLNEPE